VGRNKKHVLLVGSQSSPDRHSNNSREKVKMLGRNKLGRGSRRDHKSRRTMLAKASSHILEGTGLDVRVVRSSGLIQGSRFHCVLST
jgi:hypothetical protein